MFTLCDDLMIFFGNIVVKCEHEFYCHFVKCEYSFLFHNFAIIVVFNNAKYKPLTRKCTNFTSKSWLLVNI